MRVVLVEDHLTFRDSLRIALQMTGRFEVVGQAASGREALSVIANTKPDALVVDMMLKDTDGVSLLRELKRTRQQVPTLILTRMDHPLFLRDAQNQGALGCALKDDSLQDILTGLDAVGRRECYLSPGAAQALAGQDTTEATRALESLSPREREIFWRTLEGWSAKDTAEALFISVKTVQAHRLAINKKLGVHSPAQFAALAVRSKLMDS
jgi:DNA-binding NarL/FixJ family response regulator